MEDGFTCSDHKVRSVEEADLPVTPRMRRATVNDVHHHQTQEEEHQHLGFRLDYSLGDTVNIPSHMIIQSTPKRAIRAVKILQKHDYAFIKRSDGSYTYSILACRSKNEVTAEESMLFVMDDTGSTKVISHRHWGETVRLVSKERLGDSLRHGHTVSTGTTEEIPCSPVEMKDNKDDWVPPSITFVTD